MWGALNWVLWVWFWFFIHSYAKQVKNIGTSWKVRDAFWVIYIRGSSYMHQFCSFQALAQMLKPTILKYAVCWFWPEAVVMHQTTALELRVFTFSEEAYSCCVRHAFGMLTTKLTLFLLIQLLSIDCDFHNLQFISHLGQLGDAADKGCCVKVRGCFHELCAHLDVSSSP